jgi:SEC-C motif-containing protein
VLLVPAVACGALLVALVAVSLHQASMQDLARLGVSDCPCGSGRAYGACCGPLHRGTAVAATPEQLMRSRYSAYALAELDYVFRTWHPRTRPDDITPDPSLTWTGLRIVAADGDEVEFVASYVRDGVAGEIHERSRFEQRRGKWVYLDGDVLS